MTVNVIIIFALRGDTITVNSLQMQMIIYKLSK